MLPVLSSCVEIQSCMWAIRRPPFIASVDLTMASLLWHRGVSSPSPLILHFELHYSIGYCTLKPTNASIKCAKAVRSLAPCCMSLEVDKDRELPPNSRSGVCVMDAWFLSMLEGFVTVLCLRECV
eukprot:c20088_g1_i2 orf=152-526(+)